MSEEEFVDVAYKKRGYCTKQTAQIYVKDHQKIVYTEEDLIAVYRFQDRADWQNTKDEMKLRKNEEERMQDIRDSWL